MFRHSSLQSSAIVCASVFAGILLLSYGGGYLLLSDVEHFRGNKFRVFRFQWESGLFEPAARMEALVVGEPVETSYYLETSRGWGPLLR